MAYAQGNAVFMVEEGKKPLVLPVNDEDPVVQVRYCDLGPKVLLVTVTTKAVMAWDVGLSRMIFNHKLSSLDKNAGQADFLRGIGCIAPNKVLVGSTSGTIYMFETTDGTLELEGKLKGHKGAITALGPPQTDLLLSGDDQGAVISWTGGDMPTQECGFEARGSPVMSLAGRRDMVVAAYGTGHIRIFSRKKNMLAVEVAAHSRPVMALAMHPSQDQFVSVGEDTIVNVWPLPDFESKSSSTVDVLFSTSAKDRILVGVGFYGGDIVASAFDSGSVLIWKRAGK